MGHLYHGYVSHNQRVIIYHGYVSRAEIFKTSAFPPNEHILKRAEICVHLMV